MNARWTPLKALSSDVGVQVAPDQFHVWQSQVGSLVRVAHQSPNLSSHCGKPID